MASILGTIGMILGTYLVFGFLDLEKKGFGRG